MTTTGVSATALLRPGLLDGMSVTIVGTGEGAGHDVGEACGALGARLISLGVGALGHEPDLPPAAAGTQALVVDVAALSPAVGRLERLGLGLERTWAAVRTLAVGALIPTGTGKVILVAPRPGDGPHAGAARAAAENLARTLSVEWARHRITVVAVAPGDATGDRELAAVVAYLISPAGDYFSGCRVELGGLRRRVIG